MDWLQKRRGPRAAGRRTGACVSAWGCGGRSLWDSDAPLSYLSFSFPLWNLYEPSEFLGCKYFVLRKTHKACTHLQILPAHFLSFLSYPSPFLTFAPPPYATTQPISVSRRDRPPDACKIDRVPSEHWEGSRRPRTRASPFTEAVDMRPGHRRTDFALSKQQHASWGHYAATTPSCHQTSAVLSKLHRKIELSHREQLQISKRDFSRKIPSTTTFCEHRVN